MKRVILFILASLVLSSPSYGWGREAHETIAKIANNHLKPSARKAIERYLDNHSIVYWAKWMDDYRHTPEYRFTSDWHIVNVDKDLKYYPDHEKGDAILGMNQAIEIIRNRKEHTDSTVAVNIKYIIHLMGDMHCPVHVFYDGRNQAYDVKFGGGYIQPVIETKIHSVWDMYAIQSCRIWSVSEYAEELDRLSKKEIKAITSGTFQDWANENAARCVVQFDMAKPGDRIAQEFVNEVMPLLEKQMLYAGYRLAAVLNSLF